jgi:hypothetical protein
MDFLVGSPPPLLATPLLTGDGEALALHGQSTSKPRNKVV